MKICLQLTCFVQDAYKSQSNLLQQDDCLETEHEQSSWQKNDGTKMAFDVLSTGHVNQYGHYGFD